MIGDSILFNTDGTFTLVFPVSEKYTHDELLNYVGGDYFIVRTSKNDKCFVINSSMDKLEYNVNANYLFRRLVEDLIVLHGQILLCNCNLLQEATIDSFLRHTTPRPESSEAAE